MTNYLIVKNCIYGTYLTEVIEKKDLLDLKGGVTEAIIMVRDTENSTQYLNFDYKKNEWVLITNEKSMQGGWKT